MLKVGILPTLYGLDLPMKSSTVIASLATAAAVCCAIPFLAEASDHNEPAAHAVWRADQALHAEWDISDLFAWEDRDAGTLNLIVAWHPQQLPRSDGQRTMYNDQVQYRVHVRYEKAGVQVLSQKWVDEVITFQYGLNDDAEWGVLVRGVPGMGDIVESCESDKGWSEFEYDLDGERLRMATGMFDDPFVFDLDGYNASLQRSLDGEVGLHFDPLNDTFEGHNATALVLSIPLSAMEEHWERFEPDKTIAPTENLHVWVTTHITGAEAAREGEG